MIGFDASTECLRIFDRQQPLARSSDLNTTQRRISRTHACGRPPCGVSSLARWATLLPFDPDGYRREPEPEPDGEAATSELAALAKLDRG